MTPVNVLNPKVALFFLAIEAWPDQQGLATDIGRSGWRSSRNLTGGIVALHRAIRPT
jgi:demethylmenaquinone methyltransferase / 2-methoxy-6-polyprenyl-1,4-benzoquinol methylase